MKRHWIWMVIGCGLPLLLIFFTPALGITGYNGLFDFIILMFLLHQFMPTACTGVVATTTPAIQKEGMSMIKKNHCKGQNQGTSGTSIIERL